MMTEAVEVPTSTPTELLAAGRRNLAVREFTSAVETLASACELLAKEHGDSADQCAEAYLWYGKALLGLSREESGVLGDGVPGTGNVDAEEEDDNEEPDGEDGEAAEEKTGEAEAVTDNGEESSSVDKSEAESTTKKNEEPATEKIEAESTTNDNAGMGEDTEEPGTTNGDAEGEADADVSMMNVDGDEEVDNLQLAWEMLDLSRSILFRRVQDGGGDAARTLLADVHLALGEVALESETYDKAVVDMQSCLDLQKDLYGSDDRRIAETHYQIGLANSLASNFEDAITHFKNAANILGTRIKTLENPGAADDATVKKYATADPGYSIEGEIKELKELLPEIQEKIQDMMDYKAETIKRVRESLFGSNDAGASNSAGGFSASAGSFSASAGSFSNGSGSFSNGVGAGSSSSKPAADISHLIKRKRKASDSEAPSSAKRVSTVVSKREAEPAKSASEPGKSVAEPAKSGTEREAEPAKISQKVSTSEAVPAISTMETGKQETESVKSVTKSEADSAKSGTKNEAELAKSVTVASKSEAEPAKSAAEAGKSEAEPTQSASKPSKIEADSSAKKV